MNDQSLKPISANELKVATFNIMMVRKERIEKALSHGEEGWTFDDVLGMIISGRCTFVWNEISEAILEMRDYPSGKAIHVFTGSGDYNGLLRLYADVARLSKENGFVRMTTLGRKGFIKRLPLEGWKVSKMILFSKEL